MFSCLRVESPATISHELGNPSLGPISLTYLGEDWQESEESLLVLTKK